MNTAVLKPIADHLWMLTYPMKVLGADLRRNVTIVRLLSGKLVIHSSAPFSPEDITAVQALGKPGWILDGVLRHDTFAKEGREAFADIPYLAPEGFAAEVGFPVAPIVPAPPEWIGEVQAVELQGAPSLRETALFHVASRTLILTELLFNFGKNEPIWTEAMLVAAVGLHHHPGMPRPVSMAVKDKENFKQSIATLLAWDFDRVIVGHGDVIESGGKERVRAALEAAGY